MSYNLSAEAVCDAGLQAPDVLLWLCMLELHSSTSLDRLMTPCVASRLSCLEPTFSHSIDLSMLRLQLCTRLGLMLMSMICRPECGH